MEEVTSIAPVMENVRLPALNMRVSDAVAFIEKLNDFSMNSAGAFGYWELTGREGVEVKLGTELEALLISPSYHELNPPLAIRARDTAAGPAATEGRALEARIKSMDATLQQTRQALETLEKQVKELPAKLQ